MLAARSQPERVIRRRDKLTGAVQCGVAQKPFLVVSAVDTAIALPADICRRKKRTKVIQKPARWRGPVEVEAKRNDVVAARRERGPVIEAQRSTGFGSWGRGRGTWARIVFMWEQEKEPPVFEVPKQWQTRRRIELYFPARFPRCVLKARGQEVVGVSGEVAPRTLAKIWRRSGCVWDNPCSAHLHLLPRPTKSGSLRSLRWLLFCDDLEGIWVMDNYCGLWSSLKLYLEKHCQPPQRWRPCFRTAKP